MFKINWRPLHWCNSFLIYWCVHFVFISARFELIVLPLGLQFFKHFLRYITYHFDFQILCIPIMYLATWVLTAKNSTSYSSASPRLSTKTIFILNILITVYAYCLHTISNIKFKFKCQWNLRLCFYSSNSCSRFSIIYLLEFYYCLFSIDDVLIRLFEINHSYI